MTHERSLAKANPVLAVHVTLTWPVKQLEQALAALLHNLLQVSVELSDISVAASRG